MPSKQRNETHWYFIDLAKILSSIAVILIHATIPTIFAHGSTGWGNWWTAMTLNAASRFAVPLFIMCSGAVILLKPNITPKFFLQKRIQRVVPALLFFVPFYLFFFHIVRGDLLTPTIALKRIVFSEQFEHLYFLFLIIGLYIVTPILQPLVLQLSKKQLLAITTLFSLITIFWTAKQFMPIVWLPYIAYYLASAYVVRHIRASQIKSKHALLSYLVTAPLIAGATFFLTKLNVTDNLYFLRYSSPVVFLQSICIFIFLMSLEPTLKKMTPRMKQSLVFFARQTLGVYLIAPAVLALLLMPAQTAIQINTSLGVVYFALATIILSFSLTIFWHRIRNA